MEAEKGIDFKIDEKVYFVKANLFIVVRTGVSQPFCRY